MECIKIFVTKKDLIDASKDRTMHIILLLLKWLIEMCISKFNFNVGCSLCLHVDIRDLTCSPTIYWCLQNLHISVLPRSSLCKPSTAAIRFMAHMWIIVKVHYNKILFLNNCNTLDVSKYCWSGTDPTRLYFVSFGHRSMFRGLRISSSTYA